ncbi:unnamed protein product [Mytilus edulis]|uniref:G-protein coupled receptors family 2 profile 2 domain-containing protein n=1 Tax=Mytilus edulis TaxID=6550 RepID=A0A8S3R788_MYTED|nr:unnamed protein product [Mytilus edulis]
MTVKQLLFTIIIGFHVNFLPHGQTLTSELGYEITDSNGIMEVTHSEEPEQIGDKQTRISETKLTDKTTQPGVQMSTTLSVLQDVCFSYGGCTPPEALSDLDWYCNCDNDCIKYNDCCLQFNSTSPISDNVYECIKSNTDTSSYIGFQAVSKCSLEYNNKTVEENCLRDNLLENGPPVASSQNMVFKNKYCALCNDVDVYIPFDVKFYNLRMKPEEYEHFQNQTKTSKFRTISKYADYELVPPPSIHLRMCFANLVENNHPLCETYINPIMTYYQRVITVFRNHFCMSDSEHQHIGDCLANHMRIIGNVNDIFALSIIFSFRKPQSKDMTEDSLIECQTWSEEVERNNLCGHLETYTNYQLEIVYYMVTNENRTVGELLKIGLLSLWTLDVTNFTLCTGKITLEANDSKQIVKVTSRFYILKKIFRNEIQEIENMFNERKIVIVLRDNDTASIIIFENKKSIPEMVNSSIRFNRIFRVHRRKPLKDYLDQVQVYTPDTNDKFCNNYEMVVNIFPNDAFYIDSEKILCDYITLSLRNSLVLNFTKFLAIITYVCFSVSIISLAIFIVFSRRNRFHNSIPGSNMENLSISLLLANIMFMFGIGASINPTVCYVVGIVLHYLWLVVFTFMTIVVAKIVSNLSHLKSHHSVTNEEVEQKRRFSTFVGLFIPLLIVVPGIIVDQFGSDYWSLGYGGSVCFPNHYPANVVFFSGPVVFAVGVDFICMIHSITQICRVRIATKYWHKLNIYQDAQIYLRIVFLSGVFWIVGILAAIFDSRWLDYGFTILCGLQGLCVAVANMTTNRALKSKSSD